MLLGRKRWDGTTCAPPTVAWCAPGYHTVVNTRAPGRWEIEVEPAERGMHNLQGPVEEWVLLG